MCTILIDTVSGCPCGAHDWPKTLDKRTSRVACRAVADIASLALSRPPTVEQAQVVLVSYVQVQRFFVIYKALRVIVTGEGVS